MSDFTARKEVMEALSGPDKYYLIVQYPILRALGCERGNILCYLLSWFKTLAAQGDVKLDNYFHVAQSNIQRDLGFTEGSLSRRLKELIAMDLIEKRQQKSSSGTVTEFRLNFSTVSTLMKLQAAPHKRPDSKKEFYSKLTAAARDWVLLQTVKDNLKPHQIEALYVISRLSQNDPIEWSPKTLGFLRNKLKDYRVKDKPIDYGVVKTIAVLPRRSSTCTSIEYTMLLIATFFDHVSAFPERHPSEKESFESILSEI